MRILINNKRKAFSFLELLIVGTVFAVIFAGLVSFSRALATSTHKSVSARNQDREISNILEKVIKNFDRYQMGFNAIGTGRTDTLLDPDNLPIAWDKDILVAADQCADCPGRLGVVVRPHETLPGIYTIKMRITNSILFEGHKDYNFLSTFK